MKRIMLLCTLFMTASITGFSQFSETGYKFLKLGTREENIKNRLNYNRTGEYVTVKYDHIQLRLQFFDGILYTIESKSPQAKLEGVNTPVIGKKYKELKALLGAKLEPAPFSEPGVFPAHYIYKRSPKSNDKTSCVLEFDEKGALVSLMAAHNP